MILCKTFLTSKIIKNIRNHKLGFFTHKLKNYKIFLNFKFTQKKIIKALSVVYIKDKVSTTDRGLHFLRNWFKNKVPHHPASHK